jgi:hypothetical protein
MNLQFLFPTTFNPWKLKWSSNNTDFLTDVWLLVTIGIFMLALLWACYQTFETIIKTGRYLQFLEGVQNDEVFKSRRNLWLSNKGMPLASAFNELLLEVPAPDKPLEKILKRYASASDVFNASSLANGLVGNRFILAMPGILTGLGVLGTFVGLTMGMDGLDLNSLGDAKHAKLNEKITNLISGCSTAFKTSVWGVGCSLLFIITEKFLEWLSLSRIRMLQGTLDRLIPRYTPEESMIELQRFSSKTNLVLEGLAVAIGDEMQKAMNRLGSSITEAVRESLGNALGAFAVNLGRSDQLLVEFGYDRVNDLRYSP